MKNSLLALALAAATMPLTFGQTTPPAQNPPANPPAHTATAKTAKSKVKKPRVKKSHVKKPKTKGTTGATSGFTK